MGKIFHSGHASGNNDPVSWSEPYFLGVANFEGRLRWEAIPDDVLVNKPWVDQQVADQAIKTLRRLAPAAGSGEQPFFLAACFKKPHTCRPYVFPKSSLQYYDYDSIRLPDNMYPPVDLLPVAWFIGGGMWSYTDTRWVSGQMNKPLPSKIVIELRRAYYSAISYIDFLVGKVLTELEELGLSNNTIVAFLGDHGYMLGEHNAWCKQTNFELATHAPMMIHIPGLTDGGVKTSQLTGFVDLFPTLVEAAGLEQLPLCPRVSTDVQLCHEGSSLMPLIYNPDTPIKNSAFSQHYRRNKMGYSIRTDRYRYTEWPMFSFVPKYEPYWFLLNGVELYDHEIDPAENVNRAKHPEYAEIRKQLSKMLRAGPESVSRGDSGGLHDPSF